MRLVLTAALATLLAGGAAQAQTPNSGMPDDNLPACSRAVTDHCIQRGEAMRAAPAKHHHAAMRHHHARKMAMKRHHHRAMKHAMAKKHPRHAANTAPKPMAPAKPKG